MRAFFFVVQIPHFAGFFEHQFKPLAGCQRCKILQFKFDFPFIIMFVKL